MRKSLKITLIVLSSVAAVVLLASLLISPIAKRYIEKNSPELIGRQIEMDKLRVNLFAGSVRITGFHLSESDMKADFATFDTLYVNMSLYRLLAKEVHFDHILLTGLHVQVLHGDSTFNFSDLLEIGNNDEADADTTASEWAVALNDIRLRKGSIVYTDQVRQSSWALNGLKLYVPGVYFGGRSTQAGVSFSFPTGGSLALQLQYNAQTNRYKIDLNLNGIALDMAIPFVRDYLNVQSLGGSLTGKIALNGSLDVPTDVDVAGQLQVDTLCVKDLTDSTLLTLHQTLVDIARVNPHANVYDFSNVLVDGLVGKFELFADTTNTVSRLLVVDSMPKTDTLPAVDTVSAHVPLNLHLHHIGLTHSSATWVDHTLHSPMSYTISDIHADVTEFSFDGQNDLQVFAQMPEGGLLIAYWKGGLNLIHSDQVLALTIKNMRMTHFSPYVEYYVGSPLTDGVLSLTSENAIKQGQLKGTNNVDIYNCQVGNKNKQYKAPYHAIPLKLAVGLLKDLQGKIVFNVPVSGDINSPKFSYGKIVWKTVMNILVKAAASPFLLAAQAMGISGESLSAVPIDPLQPDFTSQQYGTLDKLAEVAKSQPDMTLILEQQLPLNEAIYEQGIFNLKREFYLSQNTEKRKKSEFSLADLDNIKQIKDKDAALISYTDQLTNAKGKSLKQKGLLYYGKDSLQNQVMRMAEFRNHIAVNYLVRKLHLKEDKVQVQTMPAAQMAGYAGKAQYTVDASVAETDND